MIPRALSRIWYPVRATQITEDSDENVRAFIESRALEYPTQLEDAFVNRALNLGVASGMVLDVGTRVGLIPLKILWNNENFFAIGLDSSGAMIEQARETATAWGIGERAVFQVGDARRMRFKTGYFDIVVSDGMLHRFDDATGILREIARVLKPKGALLIRDFCRPNRLKMAARIRKQVSRHGNAMERQLEASIRAAYTPAELLQAIENAALRRTQMIDTDPDHIMIERRGETDPNSWVVAREQYR